MTGGQTPLPTGAVIRLLVAIAARRWVNRMAGQFGKAFRRGKKAEGRSATPGKHTPSRIGAVLITALFLFIGVNVASGVVGNLARSVTDGSDERVLVDRLTHRKFLRAEKRIAEGDEPGETRQRLARRLVEDVLGRDVPYDADPLAELAPHQRPSVEHMLSTFDARGADGFRSVDDDDWMGVYPWAARSEQFRSVVALLLSLTFVCLLLMSLGNANADLGHVDWSMQWLFTLPVRARSIFLAKTLEYTLLNATSWIFHLSLGFAVLWSLGYGGWAVPIAIGATVYMNLLLAVSRLLLETWLRKRLSLQRLKSVQAVCTAVGTVVMLGLYMLSNRALPFPVSSLAFAPADALGWLPWAIPAMAIRGGAVTLVAAGLTVSCAVALTLGGVRLAEYLVRDGLIVGTGGYRGLRGAAPGASPSGGRFRGIVGREVVLLLRDRNLFVQTLILPVIVIGFQLLFSPQLFTGAVDDSRHASVLAFGIGAFVLMGGGFVALGNEGKALWLLFTFPQRIDQVLLRKAVIWGVVAAAYTLAVIVAVAVLAGGLDVDAAIGSATALAGIAIYSVIAVGIGILGTDPLAEEVQRRVRPTLVYTYMMLVALFGYGFYAPHWTKLVLVIVCALLAVAIWQIVRDRAPLLLDPVHRPAPRIALSDGLIAVLAFVVLQSIVGLAAVKAGVPPLQTILVAFVVAGALVGLTALYVFWRRGVPDILATLGLRAPAGAASLIASIARGVVLGAGAGAINVLYQRYVLDTSAVGMPALLAVLAIVAAPLFEELIFRGLVFRGLRRSTHVAIAILASAAIFAIVHPPQSFVPVFCLGLATAYSFERSGRLIAPICAHAIYNVMAVFVVAGS